MTSVRNTDRILDAAREVILTVGWRRATLTDVARRADLSRMTVYRAHPDMPSILADLMTRELVGTIDEVVRAIDSPDDGADVIARRFAGAVATLRDNELFRRIIDVDPDELLPYLIDRRGRAQDAMLDALSATIADSQQSGRVRTGDPTLMARSLLLAAHGFAISAHTMADERTTMADLEAELVILVRSYLTP